MFFTAHIKYQELQQFARFLIVGTIGTILDFSVLIVLKELFGLSTLLANTCSYSVGVVNNFSLNRSWTFSNVNHKPVLIQFGQFVVVSTGGVILNNLIVLLLESSLATWFDTPDSGYIPAKIVATLVVVFWNFFINRYWTFKDGK